MASIRGTTYKRRRATPAAEPTISSVEVSIELTAEEAALLPPTSHIKPAFPKVDTVSSQVSGRGGVLDLRYVVSAQPFGNVPATDIPEYALAAVHRWLTRRRTDRAEGKEDS